jgi:hypothetical protein
MARRRTEYRCQVSQVVIDRVVPTASPPIEPMTRHLTRIDRFWWAVGSPVRLAGLAAVTAILMWLAYISIGFSAVMVIAIVVAIAHLLPYMWSGRLVLALDDEGVHDYRRFRRRTYRWDDGYRISENARGTQQFRGLVVSRDGDDDDEPAVLLASWCKSRTDLDALIDKIRASGYPAAF